MRKTYQNEGFDTSQPAVPDTVSLSRSDLVAMTVDGVHFGAKHPLSLAESSTENATLIGGLRERGLDTTRPILVVLDGSSKALRRAYHVDSALAAELDRTHPGAAASLREGVAETLTVPRLNLLLTLAHTFRSTNPIVISICRTQAGNVRHWRGGTMALRWCAAGMVEAGPQFRRINGHLHPRSLRDTLNQITELVGATRHDKIIDAA